jgi:glycosyltransferase involved in cell wall biosynthesis
MLTESKIQGKWMGRSSPIRVVHVVGQLEMGGMEKLLIEFARHADRKRFDLHFVSLGKRGILADEIEGLGWDVTALESKPGLRPSLVFRLARLFRAIRPEVVHSHNTRPLLYAGPAARLAGVRCVVHTRHGQRFGAARRETMAFRLASFTADRVVCVSHDSARIAAEEGIPVRRIRTLWNGIDTSRFRRADPGGQGPVISVGRLSPEKDFGTLVRAAAVAVASDPSFRLEIAGDGVCAADLNRLIAELKLSESVRFLGQVRDIPSLLERGSIFAMSSLTEGVSLTLLEAMTAGLPVVATHVGGNPEVVADGQTGLLVPAADPGALAEALLKLWRDPVLRLKMGEAGRERVIDYFDVRKMVAAYEAMYLQCLQRRDSKSRPASETAAVRI